MSDTDLDRGDNFVPADEAADAAAAADATAEIAKIEAEKAEVTPEDKTEDETEAAKVEEGKTKDTRIPLARHEKMMEKGRLEREALIAENEKLRQGTVLSKTNEAIDATEERLVKMEAEYNELLGKGEIKEATAKMTEIRRTERLISDAKSDFKAQVAENSAYERVRYDSTIERIEEAYPELDPDGEDFDKDMSEKVVKLYQRLTKAGDDRVSAIKEAVRLVVGEPKSRTEKRALDTDVKVTKAELEAERKAASLKKNVEASKKQPADLSKVGLDSDKGDTAVSSADIMRMSQKEFAKLTEAELSKARGDVV